MEISTTVEVITSFNVDTIPDEILIRMSMLNESEIKEVLRQTFIQAMTDTGMLDELNSNASYAIVSLA